MKKTLDGAFGIPEFNEGFIEGVMRTVPFAGKLAKSLKECNKKIMGRRYFYGKVIGIAATLNTYVVSAYMLIDLLYKK